MTRPKVVVFDLGKVLLDFDFSKAATALQQHCTATTSDIQKLIDQSPLLHRYERGQMTTEEFYGEVKRLSGFCQELNVFAPLFGDIFTPVDSMLRLHADLKHRGIRTYIFSNTSSLAVDHIRERYPFFNTFDGYILSYEKGCMKPDAPIYEAVEQMTGCAGAEILYIDDRLENIETGAGRGWHVIHHVSPEETIARTSALFSESAR